ncbi:MAG: eukaryotic-like serine/threonine-protein kinase [Abditibacteriota bacterium]|nr:eukaryotic-like serine/threonine-protein kinase [Abditibacteriota bacterium]
MNNSSGGQSPFDNSQPTADLSGKNSSNPTDPHGTQPLPVPRTSGSGRLSGGSVLGGLQNGTVPLGNNVFDPPDDDHSSAAPTSPPSPPRSVRTPTTTAKIAKTGHLQWLPMPTLVGLAVVGGALMVVLAPALIRRFIPTVPMKQFPIETVVPDPAAPPLMDAPVVVTKPLPEKPLGSVEGQPAATGSNPKAEALPSGDDTRGDATFGTSSNTSGTGATSGELPVAEDGGHAADPHVPDNEAPTSSNRGSHRDERVAGVNRSSRSSATTSGAGSATSGHDFSGDGSGVRFVHPSTGYTISPPAGFTRQRTGRRTIWRGPGGSQLLVETTTAPGSSARADWERLSSSLAKKYGRNYRSLGIRDTTLAGRPAAVWEFEISSSRGTTRKIDVALHERGRGYAVLAEAPSTSFDELRPQLEAAISSFQPPAPGSSSGSSASSSSSRSDDDEWRDRGRSRSKGKAKGKYKNKDEDKNKGDKREDENEDISEDSETASEPGY